MQAINELGENTMYSIQNNVKYNVKEAYSTTNGYQSKYYTYGIITVANGDFTATQQEIYMIIYVDLDNNTYKLENSTKELFSYMQELLQDDKISIPVGMYNNFEYQYIDNAKQMEIYLEDYSFQLFNNTQNAYNLLNEEYRNIRFGDINEFIKYINEKQNQLRTIQIVQYNMDKENEEYIVYKGTDEYGNYYNIKETNYMEYEIILDNYTLYDYSDESTQKKVEISVEKFILMLNSADYIKAYNLLEPTFKTTNFPTEQDFINYIKNNWFARNIIFSKEVVDEGICNVIINENLTNQSNKIQKQFKVLLGENIDFTIEFNI